MPQRIRPTKEDCPNCKKRKLISVAHVDNHGGELEVLEIHCSTYLGGCGYSRNAEGKIRNSGVEIVAGDQEEDPVAIPIC